MNKSLDPVSDLDFQKKINRKYQQVKSNLFRFPVLIYLKMPGQVISQKIKLDVLFQFILHDHNLISSSIIDQSIKEYLSRGSFENLFSRTISHNIRALNQNRSSICTTHNMEPFISNKNICILNSTRFPETVFFQIMKSRIQIPNGIWETLRKYYTNIEQKYEKSKNFAFDQKSSPKNFFSSIVLNKIQREQFCKGKSRIFNIFLNNRTMLKTYQGTVLSDADKRSFPENFFKSIVVNQYQKEHFSTGRFQLFDIFLNNMTTLKTYQGTVNSPGLEIPDIPNKFNHNSIAGKLLSKYSALMKPLQLSGFFMKRIMGDASQTVHSNLFPERKSLLSYMNQGLLSVTTTSNLRKPASYTYQNNFHFNHQQKIEQEVEDIKQTVLKTKKEMEKKLSDHASVEIDTEKQYDITILSDQVYQVIEHRLRMEKELRGL